MTPVRELVDTWASLSANSAALRSAVSFARVGGLVGGGGCAVAADLGALRALTHGPDAMRAELHRVHVVHRIVITGLIIVVASGLFLMLADVDAFLESIVFWVKMAFVAALVANGAMLLKATRRVEGGGHIGMAGVRTSSMLSLALWFLTTLLGAVLPNVL